MKLNTKCMFGIILFVALVVMFTVLVLDQEGVI